MEEDAEKKKHTTTAQAIEIGRKCGVWRTVLTHFSPRYQKIAEISDRHMQNKVLVAFDHMRVRLSHLEWAYKVNQIYKLALDNDNEEEQEEKVKGKTKKQKQQI